MEDLVRRSTDGARLKSAKVARVLSNQIVHYDAGRADIGRDLIRVFRRSIEIGRHLRLFVYYFEIL